MKRVFSAVRPSGGLHLGNYLGAIKQWTTMQDEFVCFFAIADLHAITTPYDAKTFRTKVKDYILFYLAAGLNPKKCTLFIQSENPDHTELTWILNSIVTVPELKRMTQFKDKSKKSETGVTAGLFDYPALMAADILLYGAEIVPVGEDQKQHVEMANTLAKRFNSKFDEIFRAPEVKVIKETARIMSLTDPKNKMSKTGSEKSKINLSDTDEEIKKKIMSAVTDSGKEIECKEDKPAIANLLRIFRAVSGKEIKEIEKKFKGKGYASFKKALADKIIELVGPIRDKKKELESDESLFEKITSEGLEKARKVSKKTLRSAKKAAGLI